MHEGVHEPLITKDVFDRVQDAMKKRSKAKTVRLKSYVYRGLFRCGECGCGITMETQKGHNYLRCTKRVKKDCSQPFLREEQATEQIAAAVIRASLPDERANWLIERLEAERDQSRSFFDEAKQRVEKELHKTETKLDRLTTAYLDAGAFTASEFRQRKADGLNTKRKLLDDAAALNKDEVQRFEPLIRFVNGSKQVKYDVPTASPKELRAKLEIVGSNLKIWNRKLQWEPRGAWKLVVDQGSFAHANAAPFFDDAAFRGENRQTPTKWRRGESNPRPEITPMTASTRLVDFLISTLTPKTDTLRQGPAVLISPLRQRPIAGASPHFSADVTRASHRTEVA
jgi:site-specific DNA recombinase